jgi:hypothetical protein
VRAFPSIACASRSQATRYLRAFFMRFLQRDNRPCTVSRAENFPMCLSI